jgi:hypothetical protein
MNSENHQTEKEKNISNTKKVFLFLIEYSYILFALHSIITIISIYIALYCNKTDLFSFEIFFAALVPYIYLPFRYYFKDFCDMPSKVCFAP